MTKRTSMIIKKLFMLKTWTFFKNNIYFTTKFHDHIIPEFVLTFSINIFVLDKKASL